ncbi:16038_t:CDS:2 [Dentiscutata erythropus]|uniref:16038_t:CDS:1 n=1 Tax=Dentiscutata erythropus TaxID=1348616 RepID=A0A9N9IX18_9GLOM|nr:16038_t:CDS:2 [Dentiscutata erythropus]
MVQLINNYTLVCKGGAVINHFIWDISSCACDFRINIYGCPESSVLEISYWVIIPYCLLLSITSIVCLYHLICIKNEPFFFSPRSDRGVIRPRPLHIYYAIALAYCPFQIIHSLCLLYDLYPNVLMAEIGQVLPRTLIVSFSFLYPLSILYSTCAFELKLIPDVPTSRHALRKDITCIFFVLLPILIFLPIAGLTGYYVDIGDIKTANKLFMIHYLGWLIFGLFYVLVMVTFWSRFTAILNSMAGLTIVNDQKSELEIKLDQFKQNVLQRTRTIFIYGINITYLIIWNYFILFFIHVAQWVIIYNTHVAENTNIKANNSMSSPCNSPIPISKIQYSGSHDGFSFKSKKTYNFCNHAPDLIHASDLIRSGPSQISRGHSFNSLSDITTLTANSIHGHNNSSGKH